jgi:hypothetical protein
MHLIIAPVRHLSGMHVIFRGMEDEGKWEGPFKPGDPNGPELTNRAYQSNTVNLSTDGKEICAMIGPDPVQGISGYGASVHDALRDLADNLVKFGVWIEVTDPNHPWRDMRFELLSEGE